VSTIAVVGATGRTGRITVERALAAGHHVTAIARHPSRLGLDHPRLALAEADVLRPGTLHPVLPGHDAVISALGATGRGPSTLYTTGTAAIVAAMGPTRRIVVLSSAGVAVPPGAGPIDRLIGRLLHRILRDTYTDMLRMEHFLAGTDLDWTAVRPTRLTDRPTGQRPRVSIGATRPVGARTSRADLAEFLLTHLHDPATYRTAVAVSS
jgi:putative NADH-flavin reductase